MHYISRDNLYKLLDALKSDYDVYVPAKKKDPHSKSNANGDISAADLKRGKHRFYKEYAGASDDIVIGEVRAFEPLKAFFSRAREVVAKGFKPDVPHSGGKPLAIVGVKACDIKGMKIQDHVFLNHDYKDPFYIKAREQNLIISSDCTFAIDTCFCLALGLKPYPEEDFDINLSETTEGFVVECGSLKGEELVKKYPQFFQSENKEHMDERDTRRRAVTGEVEKNVKKHEVPSEASYRGMVERNFESDIWNDEAKTCVECGACNVICPTCHCFLLYDEKNKDQMERMRIWDSCMIKDFARVAGGANPRAKLPQRLRNRFEKKFDFFPKIAKLYACTGCGRCISACPAKIDIRKVLKRLVNDA